MTTIGGYCAPDWRTAQAVGKQFFAFLDTKTGGAMTRYMLDLAESW
jgi:hypothetical protein